MTVIHLWINRRSSVTSLLSTATDHDDGPLLHIRYHGGANTMPPMSRLLLIRTSSMGDLVHTLPAVTDLSRRFPALTIDWLAEESFADIARLHPAVSQVIPIALRRWRKALLSPATWKACRQVKEALRAERYDLALDSQGLLKSAVFGLLLKETPLAGYDRNSIREPLASLFYDKKYAVSRQHNAVDRNRLLFGKVFGYEPDLARCDFGVKTGSVPGWCPPRYAVLLTATSKDSKLWPEASWEALGGVLAARDGLRCVLPWGNEAELERAQRLASRIPDAVVAPREALDVAAAMLAHARLVVGVDTGLTHLANAVDVPLVAIYTDTDPARTGVVETARSRNIGGIGACPSVEAVLETLAECLA